MWKIILSISGNKKYSRSVFNRFQLYENHVSFDPLLTILLYLFQETVPHFDIFKVLKHEGLWNKIILEFEETSSIYFVLFQVALSKYGERQKEKIMRKVEELFFELIAFVKI